LIALNHQAERYTCALLTALTHRALVSGAGGETGTTLTEETIGAGRVLIYLTIAVLVSAVTDLIKGVATEATGVTERLVDHPVAVVVGEIALLNHG
jgi:hypothetical protein